ncbi:MAG: transcriptional regulator [Desulfobacteraceae bacterium]|nr:transcriptional regulator [Desulfobacteraceae bacterium]
MSAETVYKKYANRRIYDTAASRYVTLGDLADRVRRGGHVKVLDAKTNEDVTAYILTQILMEEAKNRNILLPAPLLHSIIRYGDNLLIEFFDKYLQHIIHNYLAYKRTMDEQFQQWIEMGMGLSEMTRRGFDPLNPFGTVFKDSDEDAE